MGASREEKNEQYKELFISASSSGEHEVKRCMRELGRRDLFFLLTRLLNRPDINNDWLYDRCVEIQKQPDEHLDLWAREHYKSTIITFGLSIQDILGNPNVTIGIFSHTRPIAKAFLRQIKRELEDNELLKYIYDDILWENPRKAPAWSEDSGIVVKRSSNPKEATIEAHGLVDGQPTSKHFDILVYDDVVTRESVTTPEMIAKTTDALALSYNLGARGGKRRFIGTRYHANDTYRTLLRRKTAIPRIYPATNNGKENGDPVFLDVESIRKKRRDMGPYIFGCQMLQDPIADNAQGFKKAWLRYWPGTNLYGLNVYIVCDPASSKKKNNDYTVFWVVGVGADKKYYIIDCVRDRYNLTKRTSVAIGLHRHYRPIAMGYEEYGMMADVEHLETEMDKFNYRFDIIRLGGKMAKEDRIKKLIPAFEEGRVLFPPKIIKKLDDSSYIDLVQTFIDDEYSTFPVCAHDDMLDSLARMMDEKLCIEYPDSMPDDYCDMEKLYQNRNRITGY